ncbi:hypothetical protein GL50803_0015547 [Giardia duodenalis]|uniref:Uncharacterized protein n=1 Tax=Giardia intestinalis (strain ATCC 50803 / WB clone C6) TaxID=184922 RepID=A8BZ41_GIAIC|nr:hypothetical protein GL50803_0015547 [Giardia intestinalis]KAE8301693.1 hypothetical protein GL50803_0015547 [Giardia intestinalis]|eukprot:XP_001704079.1 Hypothetical protein GL50803_15547 [Giardia lamblia ATCC 50803]
MKAILELQNLEYSENGDGMSPEEYRWYVMTKEKLRTQSFDLLKPLNPLAIPKNRQISCDLCSKRATLQCLACRSHWCTYEHFLLDSESIHFYICPKLAEVWAMSFVPGRYESIEDIVKGRAETTVQLGMLKEICEMASEKAKEYITSRCFIMAIAPSVRYIILAEHIYSTNSYEYVKANTLLVQAHLGLEKYAYVQDALPRLKSGMHYLLLSTLTTMGHKYYERKYDARTLALRTGTRTGFGDVLISLQSDLLPIRIVAKLPKNILQLMSLICHIAGTMFLDSNRFPEALDNYSHSAYLMSLAYGPTSLEATLIYYGVAKTFIRKAQIEIEKERDRGERGSVGSSSTFEAEASQSNPDPKLRLQHSIKRLIYHNKTVQEKGRRPVTAMAAGRPPMGIPHAKPKSATRVPKSSESTGIASSSSMGIYLSDERPAHPAITPAPSPPRHLKRFDRYIEDVTFDLSGEPSARFCNLGKGLKQGINMLRIIVDVWAITIRRQFNKGCILNFPHAELGDPISMLLEIQMIYSLYLGKDTLEYGHVSLTLALLYTMYDREFDGFSHVKKAHAAFTECLRGIENSQKKADKAIIQQHLIEAEDVMHALSFFVRKVSKPNINTSSQAMHNLQPLVRPLGVTATLGGKV